MMRSHGSTRDFDDWYRDEWPRLVATFTLATGDRELGREVAAEALARALERWERVGRMASPGGWAYRVGLNVLRRHHRRRRLESRAFSRLDPVAEPCVARGDEVEVWSAVASLPERERAAVALRYGADMTEPDIAAVLEVAVGTVSSSLNHARARLRSLLGESIGEESHG